MRILFFIFGLSLTLQAHIVPNSSPLPSMLTVAEGPYFKIYKPKHPIVETHLIAFPVDEWGLPYRDIWDFNERAVPEQKLAYVRAVAAAAENEGIVRQGYRIVANSDSVHPYLKMYSSRIHHDESVSAKQWAHMIEESHTPSFCFHIVSGDSLSITTLTPSSLQKPNDRRKKGYGYKGEQKYADCDISRVARGEQKGKIYRKGQHFASIKDIKPKAKFHALAVAYKDFFSHYEVFKKGNANMIQDLFDAIVLLGEKTETGSFRVTSNHGLAAHQTQPVAHFHVVADEPLGAMCYPYEMYAHNLSTHDTP